jgi:hypothetical protein
LVAPPRAALGCRTVGRAARSVVDQGPGLGLGLDQVVRGEQGGNLDSGARGRPRGVDDGVTGGAHRGQVGDIEDA